MTTTRLLVMTAYTMRRIIESMSATRLYAILFMFLALAACEKLDTTTPSDTDNKGQNSKTQNKSDNNGDEETVTAYSVDEFIDGKIADAYYETETSLPDIWVYGYIVGYVNGTSMNAATFGTGDIASNLLLADNPYETDAGNCIPIQLSTSSKANKSVRTALNLSDNPENYRQKVAICGTVTSYMHTIGLKNTTDYQFLEDDFDYEAYNKEHENTEDPNSGNNTETDDPNKTEDPNNNEGGNSNPGTDNNPIIDSLNALEVYSVADILGPVAEYYRKVNTTNHKVKGYIVGYVPYRKNIHDLSFSVEIPNPSNIVLADKPDENDRSKCIAIQLKNGNSDEKRCRKELNLEENPTNLGRFVIVAGDIASYMDTLGVKNTRDYSFP